jgi:glycosyltransferase involved in cell wall biosynthesis
MKLIIIGGSGGTNIGDALVKAANALNLNPIFLNSQSAYKAPELIKKINWHLRGKYPSKLSAFSRDVVQTCLNSKPQTLLATGIAPINYQALQSLGNLGIQRLNFLTDDPWNPAQYAPWFFKSLPFYDVVFSPRRANMDDLRRAGCRNVQYLPFGYEPELFYPEMPSTPEEESQFTSDVVFAGGADRDRVDYIFALIRAGMSVNLYGSYWERFPQTKPYTRGQADVRTLRLAISSAKIALCLVRRANRDGNCMRTFEVPAVGTCMLTEDTQEHREIFGEEGESVVYFKTIPEMVEKAQWLLNHDEQRLRLAKNAYSLITQGANTYLDRLKTMLHTT